MRDFEQRDVDYRRLSTGAISPAERPHPYPSIPWHKGDSNQWIAVEDEKDELPVFYEFNFTLEFPPGYESGLEVIEYIKKGYPLTKNFRYRSLGPSTTLTYPPGVRVMPC